MVRVKVETCIALPDPIEKKDFCGWSSGKATARGRSLSRNLTGKNSNNPDSGKEVRMGEGMNGGDCA